MIRKKDSKDIKKIMDIWIASNLDAHNFISKDYFYNNFDFVKDAIENATVYVYEQESKVIGFVGINQEFIEGIFVDRNYRSKGIGKKLIDYCKKNYNTLSLNVYCKNKKAIEFYKREGFEICEKKLEKDNKEFEYVMKWKRY